MMRMAKRLVIRMAMALPIVLPFGMAAHAQFGEAIEVRIHNIDVIVTDRAGTPVTGLRKEDFELLEDGKRQNITNFAEYAERAASVVPAAAPAAAAAPAPQPPPARHIVFFVDEMSMHPSNRETLAKSAEQMLEQVMRPGDRAMVVRPRSGITMQLAFSEDRDAVRKTLADAVKSSTHRADIAFENEWRNFHWEARHAIDPRERRMIARRHAAKVRQRVEQRLANLRAVIATLAPVEGRKVLVAISESLAAEPGKEFFVQNDRQLKIAEMSLDAGPGGMYTMSAGNVPGDFRADYVNLRPAIDELARTAAANGITIFSLQPEMDLRVAPEGEGAVPLSMVQLASGNSKYTLNSLAEKTGGKFFAGGEHADDAMRQIAVDVQSYYSLAYRATAGFDKPHKVTVRVKGRPELNVRARSEVVRKSAPRELNDRLVLAMVTESMKNDLGIAARAGEPAKGERRGHTTIDVDVIVPLSKLTFLRDGDTHRARFTVHYAVAGEDTGFITGIEPEQTVEIPDREFAEARGKIWRHTLHIDMDRKGAYHAAVAVLDGLSQTSGMAALKLEAR
jgi:VWFA-related protein